jgi:hypothetical protein
MENGPDVQKYRNTKASIIPLRSSMVECVEIEIGELECARIAAKIGYRVADNASIRPERPGAKNNKIGRVKTSSRSPGGPLAETQNYQNYRRAVRVRRRANGALRSGVFLREIVFLPRIKMRAADTRPRVISLVKR